MRLLTAVLAVTVATSVLGLDEFDGAPEHSINVDTSASSVQASRPRSSSKTHTLLFRICQSWGYANKYHEIANYLKQRFPEFNAPGAIVAENYPAAEIYQIIVQLFSFVQIALYVVVFLGDTVFSTIGMTTPGIVTTMQNNKLHKISLWFVQKPIQKLHMELINQQMEKQHKFITFFQNQNFHNWHIILKI